MIRRLIATSARLKSSHTTSNAYSSVISRLKDQVEAAQKSDSYLISLVNKSIETNLVKLSLELGAPATKESVYQALLGFKQNGIKLERRLFPNRRSSPSLDYNKFLFALYPSPSQEKFTLSAKYQHSDSNNKYHLINHDKLYENYCKLPYPAPLFIEHEDLENFLIKFLKRRDFKMPTVLSHTYNIEKSSPKTLYELMKKLMLMRHRHVSRCSKIFNDLKSSKLPISVNERNQFILLSFHKDSTSLLKRVDRAISKYPAIYEKYQGLIRDFSPVFNWDTYTQILGSFGNEIEKSTQNTLLKVAIMHEQPKVISDIVERIEPNHEAYKLILRYSQQIDSTELFFQTLASFLNSTEVLNTGLLNRVFRGLIQFGYRNEVENLLMCLISPNDNSSELEIYKRLNSEDDTSIDDSMEVYDNLVKVLKTSPKQFKLSPDRTTFSSLLESYCSCDHYFNIPPVTFNQLDQLLHLMVEQSYLPLLTKDFKMIFERFCRNSIISNGWNIEALNSITGKLLNTHDALTNDSNIKHKLNKLEMTPQLSNFVDHYLTEYAPTNKIPRNRGSLIKLPNDLVFRIYDAYINTINISPFDEPTKSDLMVQLESHRSDLMNQLDKINSTNSWIPISDDLKRSSYIAELNYVKKGYLIGLLDILESL